MTRERLVELLHKHLVAVGTEGWEEWFATSAPEPPLRRKLAPWFQALDERGRDCTLALVRYAVQGAVFELFCIVDGCATLYAPEEEGRLELRWVPDDGSAATEFREDHEADSLHDIMVSGTGGLGGERS